MTDNEKELREDALKYFLECSGPKYWQSKWALDSTGTWMPLDMAWFGAKWQRNHVWHKPDDEPKEYRMVLFSPTNGKYHTIGKTYHYMGTYYISAHGEMYYRHDITAWAYLDDLLPQEEEEEESGDIVETTMEERVKLISNDEDNFINEMKFTEFEDGMSNDIIKRACKKCYIDKEATLTWLKGLFERLDTRYKYKILRTIASVFPKDCLEIVEPLVNEGMKWYDGCTQEAAIMLAEELRSEACISALTEHPYASDWLQNYGEKVLDEIKKEHSK